MKKIILSLACLLMAGCAYKSQITFSEDGRSATLEGNVKTSAEIDLKEKKAKLNQIGISPMERLKGLMPDKIETN